MSKIYSHENCEYYIDEYDLCKKFHESNMSRRVRLCECHIRNGDDGLVKPSGGIQMKNPYCVTPSDLKMYLCILRRLEDGSYEEVGYQDIVDKLNENQQLKKENERLSRLNESKREQIKFHVDGYNQLKEVNKHSEETIKKQHELIKQLSQENCKIRQIIREAVNSERTDLGRSVLKNLALNIGVEL